MKVSEVTGEEIKSYLRITDNSEDETIEVILMAVKAYVKSYTGLTQEIIDSKEDITIAIYVLCAEMYENRLYTVENNKVNVVVKSILDMHSINLL